MVLLTYVAVALDRVAPSDRGVFEALASPGRIGGGDGRAAAGSRAGGLGTSAPAALDDVHAIRNPQGVDAIVALAGHIAEGSQLALAARDGSALPMGLLRAHGLSLELGSDNLRMDTNEARELLSSAGLEISDRDVDELVSRTEGWPAGLYLAALSSGTGVAPGELSALTGNHPFIADFLRSEFFAQPPPHELRFLTTTSMLEQMSGPLCDVLASSGSADILASLAHSNRFVVSLDRNREWWRLSGGSR